MDDVNRLLDRGVDPSAGDNAAIRWAAWKGHLDVVNRLLEDSNVDPSANDNAAIRSAAENGHLGVVNRLLEHGVDPSAGERALIEAAGNGHLGVVNRLLDDGVDPSANVNAAIRLAAWKGHLDVVNRLLEDSNVDPSANDNAAIRSAAENGHLGVVNRLLDHGVDPSVNDNVAIRSAAYYGHLDVVSCLIGDSRVARTVRYYDLAKLEDEDKIKSILQSIFMKNNIPRKDLNRNEHDSQLFSGSYDRIIRDPRVKSALQSQDMPGAITAVSDAWGKIVDAILKWQAHYLWKPEGPRAKKLLSDWHQKMRDFKKEKAHQKTTEQQNKRNFNR